VIIFAICMIIFGAGLVAIGLFLPMLAYAIVGGIMALVGIFLAVSIRRSRGKPWPPFG
jgi:uncharacterized membrane protein